MRTNTSCGMQTSRNAKGLLVVSGVDGTAVNGGASVAVTGVRTIRVEMNAGEDRVDLLEVDVEQRVLVKLGPDRDTFRFEGGRVGGKLEGSSPSPTSPSAAAWTSGRAPGATTSSWRTRSWIRAGRRTSTRTAGTTA
jgi:hypothetical protein